MWAGLKEEKRKIAIIGKEAIERKLKHLKIKLNNNTETQLIKFFETGSSQELYYRIGIGAIGNPEIKKFVKLKNSGWYQAIKNKFYGPPTLKKDKIENGKIIVFGENDEKTII